MTILWEVMVSSTNLPTDEAEAKDWREIVAKAISTSAVTASLATMVELELEQVLEKDKTLEFSMLFFVLRIQGSLTVDYKYYQRF